MKVNHYHLGIIFDALFEILNANHGCPILLTGFFPNSNPFQIILVMVSTIILFEVLDFYTLKSQMILLYLLLLPSKTTNSTPCCSFFSSSLSLSKLIRVSSYFLY